MGFYYSGVTGTAETNGHLPGRRLIENVELVLANCFDQAMNLRGFPMGPALALAIAITVASDLFGQAEPKEGALSAEDVIKAWSQIGRAHV